METEMSYIDLLKKLKADVVSDTIPHDDKTIIYHLISQLEEMLWQYSY